MAKYVTVQVTRREPPAPVEITGPQCKKCRHGLQDGELEQNFHVCPYCGYHYPMPAHSRVALLADAGSVSFIADDLRPADPLEFFDLRPYPERFSEAQRETGLTESMLAALCTVSGYPTALGVMDFKFMGGSMGSVLGERFFRLAQAAIADRRALVVIASSGGARMQEGLFSLMQMAKTVTAARLGGRGRPALHHHPDPSHHGRGLRQLGPPRPTSSWPSPARSCSSPGAASSSRPPGRSFLRTSGPPRSSLSQGQVDMVVHRLDLKDRLTQCLYFMGSMPGGGDRYGRA